MTLRILLAMAAAAVLAAGCATPPVLLPGGQVTLLRGEALRIRTAVDDVHQRAAPGPVAYRPSTVCTYFYRSTQPDGSVEVSSPAVSLSVVNAQARPEDQRLLVSMVSEFGPSTALLGLDGRLHDYNLLDPRRGRRVDPSSMDGASDALLGELRAQGLQGFVINQISVMFPHFTDRDWRPGDRVAVVPNETGAVWATFIYRGLLNGDAPGSYAVLDLVRRFPAAPQAGEVVVGFNIIRLEDLVPIHVELASGYEVTFRRVSCS